MIYKFLLILINFILSDFDSSCGVSIQKQIMNFLAILLILKFEKKQQKCSHVVPAKINFK